MLLTVDAVDDPDLAEDWPNFGVLMNTPFDTMVPTSEAIHRSVLANDEAPGWLTATQITSPAHGVLENFRSDGHFQYVPEHRFVGEVSFQYRATDIWFGGSDTATVTLNVHRRPYAKDDGILVTPPDVIVVGNVLANDRDPDQTTAGTGFECGHSGIRAAALHGTRASSRLPDCTGDVPAKVPRGVSGFVLSILEANNARSDQGDSLLVAEFLKRD